MLLFASLSLLSYDKLSFYQQEFLLILITATVIMYFINPAEIKEIKIKKTRVSRFIIIKSDNKKDNLLLSGLRFIKQFNILLSVIIILMLFLM